MTMPDRAEMLSFELAEIYNDSLLNEAYQKLTQAQVSESAIDQRLVEEALKHLIEGLHARRNDSSDQEWNSFVSICLRHPLREMLHQDPFTLRAFAKPRGYAGDAPLLDYIYGREEHWPEPAGMTPLGRSLFDYTTLIPATEGVRARRGFIADLLDRLADSVNRPHILSIAAGHLREAILCSAIKRRKIGRFVALDSDTESLEVVDRDYARFGVQVVPASIRQILVGSVDLGQFDLVYSTGLFDYVKQSMAQRLTKAMFGLVRPGGRLLVANFMPGIRDIGYMESFMAWELIYRTRLEMMDISSEIPQADIRDIRIFTDESHHIIFLDITRR